MQHFAILKSPLGDALKFSQLSAQESVSEPFTYVVTALSAKADLDFNALLGQHITVHMALAPHVSGDPRCFDGLVERVALVGRSQKQYQYQLVLRPWFWFLTQTQDCKVFQNQTVLQIIEEVLGDHAIAAFDNRTTAGYTPWVYCVQYRESDFNFLSRLMEQEGIRYHFEHSDGKHTMVLTDSGVGHSTCPGCDALEVRYADATAASRDEECVFDLSSSQRVQPGAAIVQDYDFTRPSVNVSRGSGAPGNHALGDMEVFDYPGLYDKEADGEQFIASQMEAFAAGAFATSGSSDARALACGGLIKLQGSVRPSDNVEFLILGTQILVSQPSYEGGTGNDDPGYQCQFNAIASKVQYRAPRRTPKPFVQGPSDGSGRRSGRRRDLHRLARSREGAIPLGPLRRQERIQFLLGPRQQPLGRQELRLRPDPAHWPGGHRRLPRRRPRPTHHHRPRLQRRADPSVGAAGEHDAKRRAQGKDRIVDQEQSIRLDRALKANGKDSTLVLNPEGGHVISYEDWAGYVDEFAQGVFRR